MKDALLLDKRHDISERLVSMIVSGYRTAEIYFIGSMNTTKSASFNAELSDVDLLVIPKCSSLDDYVVWLKQAMRLSVELSQEKSDRLVDVFMMSSNIVDMHFTALSVIAGENRLRNEDIAYGSGRQHKEPIVITNYCRKNLYITKAAEFRREYIELLPEADTSKARKTAKLLLRGLKLIICANTDADELTLMEEQLFSVDTFEAILPIFADTTTVTLELDDIIKKALAGGRVDDWPAWMISQDVVARQLDGLKEFDELSLNDHRLYGGMSRMRDLLIIDLKNIISQKDAATRLGLIDDFANNTASVISRLSLAGVESLVDFENSTSGIVRESYAILVEYLKGEMPDIRSLAASVVLLEYAFKQSIRE